MQVKKPVITPGGRRGNDARHGSRSNGTNWVERTRRGSLPDYIRIVRNGLMKEGRSEAGATAIAIAAMKVWARGGGNVRPQVRAAAAKALAEWEAMKAEKSINSDYLALKMMFGSHSTGRKFLPHMSEEFEWTPEMLESKSATDQGEDMQMEHKTVGVSGLKVLDTEGDGIVEAYVSVTGMQDNVKDVIESGAYEKTLQARTPKGIWSHDWDKPISKTLDIKEMLPGSEGLPKTLPNGDPWPADAGALYVKMQFNMGTERGRDAYADVTFFGDEQEWSIGYNVPAGGASVKSGVRHIKMLDLYEFSPVLFGAMPAARSTSVKEAQLAYKSLQGEDIENWVMEMKADGLLPDDYEFDVDDVDANVEVLDDEVGEADFDTKTLAAVPVDMLTKALHAIQEVLDAAFDGESKSYEPSVETKTFVDALDELSVKMDADLLDEMKMAGEDFDTAIEEGDHQQAEDHATSILDMVDEHIDSVDGEELDAMKSLARVVHDILTKTAEDEEDDADLEDESDKDDDDTSTRRKPIARDKPADEDQDEEDEEDAEKKGHHTVDSEELGNETKSLEDFLASVQ